MARKVRILVALVLVVSALGAVGGSAGAAQRGSFGFAEKGVTAQAGVLDCVRSGAVTTCDATQVYAFDGKQRMSGIRPQKGTFVCVDVFSFSYEGRGEGFTPLREESGCTVAPRGALDVGKKLSSARLAPTAVKLEELVCTPTGPDTGTCEVVGSRQVTVSAQLTATSGPRRMAYRESFEDEGCTLSFSAKSTGRRATAVITLDGDTVTGPTFGSIERGMFRVKGSCR